MTKKGFTLVELSIVLVIIGLLVGGILASQSMIKAAQINKTVKLFGQFDAAFSNFRTHYNSTPGDSTSFASADGAGDGDGFIEDNSTNRCDSVNHSTVFRGEIGKFWADMSLTGFKSENGGNYKSTTPSDGRFAAQNLVNTYIPKLPLGNNVGVIACGDGSTNWYKVSSFYTDSSNRITADNPSSVTSIDSYSLDEKMDDGNINAGRMSGYYVSYSGQGLRAYVADTGTIYCHDASNSAYNMEQTGRCSLRVVLGSQLYR